MLRAGITKGGDREVIAVERPRYTETFRTYIASPWGQAKLQVDVTEDMGMGRL